MNMNTVIFVATFIVGMFIIAIGIYLSLKIIKISIKEKSVTWRLDITNAIIVISHHLHCLLMEFVTLQVRDLHAYTGRWFCYTSMVLNYYGNIYTAGHSMIVGLMKYFLIVQWKKVMDVGEDKVKNIFFFVNIFYSVGNILIHLVVMPSIFVTWDAFARVDRCLGDPKNNWESDGLPTNRTQIKLHMICSMLIEDPPNDAVGYVIQHGRFVICGLQIVFLYLAYWNVFEALIYTRIFLFMKR